MEPTNLRFGGGATDTILSPLIAILLVVAVILILCLPRRYAIAPLIFTIFTVPLGQVVVLLGLHFSVMRIVILAGLTRLLISGRGLKGGTFPGGFNWIDRIFAFFALAQMVTFWLMYMGIPPIFKSLGSLVDVLGAYCVVRFLVRDREDVRRAIKVFAVVAVVVGANMICERALHTNIFLLASGVKAVAAVRLGSVRSQGAFSVYLTAGAFGATLIPLFVWLWSDKKSRAVAVLGIAGALGIALTTVSSSPVVACFAGIAGLCFWPLRSRLRLLRWCMVFSLIGLQLVMKAPVWALIGRIDLTGSSSGYHRYMLVDNFIRHFGDWWLIGFSGYDKWGWDMWDLSNQFVAYGLNGGLITLTLVLVLLSLCFAGLGRARKMAGRNLNEAWFFWCLGAALFAHVVAFFGMCYFDQMQFSFYFLVATISVSLSGAIRQPVRKLTRPQSLWELESESDLIEEYQFASQAIEGTSDPEPELPEPDLRVSRIFYR